MPPLDIHVFSPSSRQPAPSRTAVVAMAPTCEAARAPRARTPRSLRPRRRGKGIARATRANRRARSDRSPRPCIANAKSAMRVVVRERLAGESGDRTRVEACRASRQTAAGTHSPQPTVAAEFSDQRAGQARSTSLWSESCVRFRRRPRAPKPVGQARGVRLRRTARLSARNARAPNLLRKPDGVSQRTRRTRV